MMKDITYFSSNATNAPFRNPRFCKGITMPYTIVYTESMQCGSHSNTLVCIKRITTDDIKKVVHDYGGAIVYVFEGHPKLEGEVAEDSADFLKVETL